MNSSAMKKYHSQSPKALKIPSVPVEMPKNYMAAELSDITFGFFDLKEEMSVPDASAVVEETGPPHRSPKVSLAWNTQPSYGLDETQSIEPRLPNNFTTIPEEPLKQHTVYFYQIGGQNYHTLPYYPDIPNLYPHQQQQGTVFPMCYNGGTTYYSN